MNQNAYCRHARVDLETRYLAVGANPSRRGAFGVSPCHTEAERVDRRLERQPPRAAATKHRRDGLCPGHFLVGRIPPFR